MKSGLIVLGIIFILYFLFFNNSSSPVISTNGYNNYDSEYDGACRDRISDYQSALEEANDNIERANEMIEEAKRYTWESYDEMGEALDNLETVDTVSEP